MSLFKKAISPVLAKKDFFISYTGVDKEVADWIAFCLEDTGYRVSYQEWDFRPGNNFILLMDQALYRAKHVLAILSPAYQEALYTMPEWATVFADDPQGFIEKSVHHRSFTVEPASCQFSS